MENKTKFTVGKLLTTNAKLEKSVKGYALLGLQLSPNILNSTGQNVCAHASPQCKAVCLASAGRGAFQNVKQARINRTDLFFSDRQVFMYKLIEEIEGARKKAKKKNVKLAVRLNTLSDLPWENLTYEGANLMQIFPDVQFYDYTKNPNRAKQFANGKLPKNYHLTFSRSECNDLKVDEVLDCGGNVAVVFRDELPKKWRGKKVVDGDINDARFLDGKNVVVGLLAKGKAKKETGGFVI